MQQHRRRRAQQPSPEKRAPGGASRWSRSRSARWGWMLSALALDRALSPRALDAGSAYVKTAAERRRTCEYALIIAPRYRIGTRGTRLNTEQGAQAEQYAAFPRTGLPQVGTGWRTTSRRGWDELDEMLPVLYVSARNGLNLGLAAAHLVFQSCVGVAPTPQAAPGRVGRASGMRPRVEAICSSRRRRYALGKDNHLAGAPVARRRLVGLPGSTLDGVLARAWRLEDTPACWSHPSPSTLFG